jgi:uncharacterized damage-inducible protein DinB
MMKNAFALAAGACLAVSVTTVTASAQEAAGNPYTTAIKEQAARIHGLVLKSAEKVPEEMLSFRPTPEVRSFGAILGHIADASSMICGTAKGDKPEYKPVHEKKTTKAELIAALNESKAVCDQVFAALTDANGTEAVDVFGQRQPKLAVMAFNNNHVWEHYGNLVTYMRLKNIVPPSSERASQ